MKKSLFSLLLILSLSLCMLAGCSFFEKENKDDTDMSSGESSNDSSGNSPNDTFSIAFNDITLNAGSKAHLVNSVKVGEDTISVAYTFSGNAISIENGTLTALVPLTETVITAEADGFSTTFKVNVTEAPVTEAPVPEVAIAFNNVTLSMGREMMLVKSITVDGVEKTITYTYSGDGILISDYKLIAKKHNTDTIVTAKADGSLASFKVTVGGDTGTMNIEAPAKIYSNYAPKPIKVTFSDPAFASEVTYTTSNSNVKVNSEGIYATGKFSSAVDVTVTARSEYHTETFTVNVSTYNEDSSETKVQYYEENIITPENKGGTIFIGDSYFDGYKKDSPPFWSDFYTDYTDTKTFLMGISSSQIDNWEIVSERIVYPMEPKEIVLHIGFNDAHSTNKSAYEIATRIIALLEQFREKLPDTKIYYCTVEPKKNALTSSQYYESSMIKAPLINAIMEAYTYENKNVKLVNTRQLCFNADGSINQSFYLTTDLSHPTLAAYDSYRQLIEEARGNAFVTLTPSEVITQVTANQSAVNTAAAAAKTGSTVYTVDKAGSINSEKAVYFKNASGNALTNCYSISGYMEITDLLTTESAGAHIQFRFSNTTNDRFLLFDSNKNSKLGICAPFCGKGTETSSGAVTDAIDVTGGSAVVQWQVVVTEKTAYLYINGVLALYGEPSALSYFNVSSQSTSISIFGVELTVKSENADKYNKIVEEKKLV